MRNLSKPVEAGRQALLIILMTVLIVLVFGGLLAAIVLVGGLRFFVALFDRNVSPAQEVSLQPPEHINCRCETLPVEVEEGFIDPVRARRFTIQEPMSMLPESLCNAFDEREGVQN